VTVTYGMAEH